MNEIRVKEGASRLRTHSIHLDNRELLSVTGVRDVGSFCDTELSLSTDAGSLVIEGTGIHITRLDLDDGLVTVEGEICAMVYEDEVPEKKGSIFSRMFR